MHVSLIIPACVCVRAHARACACVMLTRAFAQGVHTRWAAGQVCLLVRVQRRAFYAEPTRSDCGKHTRVRACYMRARAHTHDARAHTHTHTQHTHTHMSATICTCSGCSSTSTRSTGTYVCTLLTHTHERASLRTDAGHHKVLCGANQAC